MNLRSIGLGLLLAAATTAALAQAPLPSGQDPNGAPAPKVRPQPYIPPTPLPVPPMNPEPKTEPVPLRFTDPAGYGWCRYTDDLNKRTFYSAPFPGAPKHDISPRDTAFADYIHRTFPGAPGGVNCYWRAFDSAYDSQVNEEQSESADQLRNYKMVNTQWKPPTM